MGNLFNMLILVFSLSAIFMIAGFAIMEINGESSNPLYSCENSIMNRYGNCSNTDINAFVPNSDATLITTNLPKVDTSTSGVSVVVQTISNVFSSIGDWISKSLGLDYIQTAIDTPRLILMNSGLSKGVVMIISGLFVAVIGFLFIDWMKGAFA